MKKHVFLFCISILILILLVAVPTLAATVTCPASCSCLLPAEAKKTAVPGYCQGKQAVCGYDTQKNEKYCFEKPATTAAVPQIIVTGFQVVTTTPTTVPPQKCAAGCTCLSTADGKGKGLGYCGGKQVVCGYGTDKTPLSCFAQPADPAVMGVALNTSARAAVTATVPAIVSGLHRVVPTTNGIPSVSPVNYTERYTTEVRCPAGCACLLSADGGNRGLSYCGGKQMACTVSSDLSAKGTGAPAESRSCYAIPVAAGTSPNLSRVAVVNRTPVIPIPLPKECPEGCSCLDEKTIREKGYSDCGSEKTECGYSKTAGVLYCARAGSGSGLARPSGDIFSSIGSFFGSLFGGSQPTVAIVQGSTVLASYCADRYGPGYRLCDGECVDITSDDDNCGGCGNWCNVDPNSGYSQGYVCDDGQCLRESAGPNRCGPGGDITCPAGAPCLDGVCSALGCLDASLTDCNNSCIRTSDDINNCGTCGNTCLPNQTCAGGTCRTQCDTPGEIFCMRYIGEIHICTDPMTDQEHCGRCQHMCAGSEWCSGGECRSECPAGTTNCGTSGRLSCADVMTSRSHCGACGNACEPSETCMRGTCQRPGLVIAETPR